MEHYSGAEVPGTLGMYLICSKKPMIQCGGTYAKMRHPELYIRSLAPDDLVEVTQLLDCALERDEVDVEWVRDKTFKDIDYDPDLTLVALDGGRIVGFIQALTRVTSCDTAWVKWFATLGTAQRTGVMTSLFDRVEWILCHRGNTRVRIADCPPNFAFPGVDHRYEGAVSFLTERGYTIEGTVVNMTADLLAFDWSTLESSSVSHSPEAEVRRADRSDMQRVFSFLRRQFPHWVPEIAACFLRKPVSLHIAIVSGEMAAFAAYDGNNPSRGWFGPMGTSPEHRQRGFGRTLLYRCLQDIRNQGHATATIPWVGPVEFYSRTCSATVDRSFYQMEKRLKGTEV